MSDRPDLTTDPNDATLHKLEFFKVLDRVSALAVSEPGRKATLTIRPMKRPSDVRARLAEVTQAKRTLLEAHDVPMSSFRDVRPSLKRSTVEHQALAAAELLDIALVLRTSREMRQFLRSRAEHGPQLRGYEERLHIDKVLEYNIAQAIESDGHIKDSASRTLGTIRRNMSKARDQLQQRLTDILRRVSRDEFTQDDIITTRDGRMVIPIKAEFKHKVSGFMHSTSASGATVFIEPTETLELNNTLRELQIAEQREIHAILLALTAQVGEAATALDGSLRTLIVLDVLFACARYSVEVLGEEPDVADGPVLSVRNGRHPVLLQRLPRTDVVPLSLDLDADHPTLVITGPNAGGKSVALKTAGLLAVCAMAGLHIPASADSRVGPFTRIYVDIGDDQSLERDLSTFSSHLVHLRDILSGADGRSLVLLDEIGTGTDPDEGSALAEAVLTELTRRRALTIATTHHSSLKAFAHATEGVTNGSMEFDTATLSPTYRFQAGVPGSSFALELSERIGLPAAIVRDARTRLGAGHRDLERLLNDLAELRAEAERRARTAAHDLEEAKRLGRQYAEKLSDVRQEVHAMHRQAREEAEAKVREAQVLIERLVREIRETQASKESIRSAQKQLSEMRGRLEGERLHEVAPGEPPAIRIGDTVRMRTTGRSGEVAAIEGSRATVLVGSLRIKAPVDALERLESSTEPAATPQETRIHDIDMDASTEIDVRGMYLDEALDAVQRGLDKAHVAGLRRVDIVHGKGTGALRKGIGEYLKTAPYVRQYRPGEWNEGGAGVTIVEFQE